MSVAGRVENWTEEEKSYSLGREYSKNYEKIRSFIRPTFFGACYTIPEYQEYFGINPNTVNNKGRKTLEFVFTEPVTLNRKQGNNFLLDLFSDEGKALYRTFELIGPTRQQLYHEVEIRDLLKNTGEGLTLAELSQAVSERAMDRLTYLLENRDEKQSDVFYDTLKYFFSENSSIGRRDSLETVLERMKS